uniref:Uncharacterized protein n=1 Tax=Zea mays TaxID=4577 RepID=C0PIS2_MAIZE|nr:unknown [Zea mays]|eukprot:XP_008652519.1 uncharacterized protein LOC100501422 [Zea mays]
MLLLTRRVLTEQTHQRKALVAPRQRLERQCQAQRHKRTLQQSKEVIGVEGIAVVCADYTWHGFRMRPQKPCSC